MCGMRVCRGTQQWTGKAAAMSSDVYMHVFIRVQMRIYIQGFSTPKHKLDNDKELEKLVEGDVDGLDCAVLHAGERVGSLRANCLQLCLAI